MRASSSGLSVWRKRLENGVERKMNLPCNIGGKGLRYWYPRQFVKVQLCWKDSPEATGHCPHPPDECGNRLAKPYHSLPR